MTTADRNKTKIAVICALWIAMCAVYWQLGSCGFINFDDNDYVYDNPVVRNGLSLPGLFWAVSSTQYSNWFPLTWLSHMADVTLFGLNPAGHHLVSLALHGATASALFLLLCRLTAETWKSAAVAALFALHPLHVESVAWVAERKDVLSSLFGVLSLYFYAGWAREKKARDRWLALLWYALSLMSKPMLVTLPFLMLVLDYWPLGRAAAGAAAGRSQAVAWLKLAAEKWYYFLLSLGSCLVTLYVQGKGGAVRSLQETPLAVRLANAVLSYLVYLEKTVWPVKLAVLYPFPSEVPPGMLLAALATLTAVSAAAVILRRRHPYLLAGWLWYVGSLVPVIGIVRVGPQALADRYSYLPLTGVFVIGVWGSAELARHWPRRRLVLASAAVLVLSACALVSWRQASYWKDNFTLYARTLAVTEGNYVIENNLAFALNAADRPLEAMRYLEDAVRIAPHYADARVNLGVTLSRLGRVDEAIAQLSRALEMKPDSPIACNALGSALLMKQRPQAALQPLQKAVALEPSLADGHYNLGLAFSVLGRPQEAAASFRTALKLKPSDLDCRYNLGLVLLALRQNDEAAAHFGEIVRVQPGSETAGMARQKMREALGETPAR